MSGTKKTREEWLKEQYPAIFDTMREAKLPVWAQFKLADLRELLLTEAADNDGLRVDIERQGAVINRLRQEAE